MLKISGWGNYPKINCKVEIPSSENEIKFNENEKIISRGLGRSYGDSSLQTNKTIITKNLNQIISFDEELGVICVQSGISSDELLKILIPKGWFLPVSPGTKFVTLGGMVASDVHGKNHHLEGSFGDHLISLKIKISNSEVMYCSDDFNSDLFWATIGGMGLTGIITEIKFKLKKISSYKINQEVTVTQNLEEVMSLFEKYKNSTYTVAWIDCLSKGSSFGRSVFFKGEHKLSQGKISYNPKYILRIPFFFPSWILNYFSIKLFNYFYFYSNKFFTKKEVDGDSFFYPLDKISHWNKIYGKNGFIQYQFLVPKKGSLEAIREVLEKVTHSKEASFLSVLKLFKKGNKGLLSFPDEGFTLAMDFQVNEKTFRLLSELDKIVMKHSGKVYLAKDSRLSKDSFSLMNYDTDGLRNILNKYNIKNFHSEQSERLNIL